jgi:hypothetical protein
VNLIINTKLEIGDSVPITLHLLKSQVNYNVTGTSIINYKNTPFKCWILEDGQGSVAYYEYLSPSVEVSSFITLPDHLGYISNNNTFKVNNLKQGEKMYIVLLTIEEKLYIDRYKNAFGKILSGEKIVFYCQTSIGRDIIPRVFEEFLNLARIIPSQKIIDARQDTHRSVLPLAPAGSLEFP